MASETSRFIVRDVVRSDHPDWQAWKSIYYASFPLNERMSEESFLRIFEDKAVGKSADTHIVVLAAAEDPHEVVGMANYVYERNQHVGLLWYIATESESRNKGYGANLYANICRRLVDDGARMMVFEVEIPEKHQNPQDGNQLWAQRRINWYKRQGAYVLDGIQYFQSVDTGVPSTEMWLMVHPFTPTDADQVFSVCQSVFEDSLKQVGELNLIGGISVPE